MARKDFVAVHFPMLYRKWGEDVSLEAIWHKKINTKLDEEENFEIFQPPKVHAAQDEAKTGGAALSLLGGWTTDDEEDTKEKNKNNHNKTRKSNHPTQPAPAPK